MRQELNVVDRDRVRWIELDRPDSKNGLTVEINAAIIEALRSLGADTRAVVIAGAGGSFCSGLDLKDAMRRGPATREQNEQRMRDTFHGLIRALRAVPVPTIAAVDGAAVGFGCDLALACDLRVLSDRARFGEIFVRRGLMPDGGGTWFLPRLIGLGRALELMYTGRLVEAEEAHRIGLGSSLVPSAQLVEHAWELARQIAAGPPLAHRLIKEAVYGSLDGDLDAALQRELDGQLQCLQSQDFVEGVTAFLQKRPPTFTGE